MAIDTRDKRAACLGLDRVALHVWPNPDGAITGQGDRQQMGLVYRGILASGAAPVTDEGGYHKWQMAACKP